ncbi:MAG: hypothetical protein E3J76_04210 [Candidatus Aminicenantes bacterium]|nr:MAG: hypothetical protein E3J76_04210 [Candidatus Aminicenantes bacterium]
MSRLISRNGLSRLSADYYDCLYQLYQAGEAEKLIEAYKQVLNVIEHSTNREIQAVLSTKVFLKDDLQKKEIESIAENLEKLGTAFREEAQNVYKKLCRSLGIKAKAPTLSEDEKKLRRIIPVRAENFICPLQAEYIEEKLSPEALRETRLSGYAAYEALNFADGNRSILDITNAVSAEFGAVNPLSIYTFFKLLQKAELIQFKVGK